MSKQYHDSRRSGGLRCCSVTNTNRFRVAFPEPEGPERFYFSWGNGHICPLEHTRTRSFEASLWWHQGLLYVAEKTRKLRIKRRTFFLCFALVSSQATLVVVGGFVDVVVRKSSWRYTHNDTVSQTKTRWFRFFTSGINTARARANVSKHLS